MEVSNESDIKFARCIGGNIGSEKETDPRPNCGHRCASRAHEGVVVKKLDAIAQKVIVTTVGPQPTMHIINCESAAEMWQKLSSIYEQKSEASIYTLQQDWYNATKQKADNISTHIAKLEDIAHRLKLMGEEISDSMMITKILMTLSESFKHFISAWESAPAGERKLDNLKARLATEESRITDRGCKSGNALTSSTQRGRSKRGRGGRFRDASNGSSNPGKCYVCGELGHWARECQQRKGDDDPRRSKTPHEMPGKKPCGEGLVSAALPSTSTQPIEDASWIMDSGASDHMCFRKDWFITYETFHHPMPVRIGDGGCIQASGKGCINVEMFNGEVWNQNHLIDVLYVPRLKYNLFSTGAALDKGLEMQSTSETCKLIKKGRTIATGTRRGKFFVMQFAVKASPRSGWRKDTAQAYVSSKDTLQNWHERLAHQNFRHVRQILKRLEISVKEAEDPFCEACTVGKMHRLPFPESTSRAESIGEVIHADLCGPMPAKSLGGSKYFLLLKDDYSHYREVFFLESKAETVGCVKRFFKKTEKHCPRGIRIFRTDNGLEFVNRDMKMLTDAFAIRHQRTVVHTPEQNGSTERDNRTLKEAGRTLMLARGFGAEFWAEAINTAVTTLNLTGTSSIKGATPSELWFRRKPNVKDLHIFGEEVFTHVPKEKRRTFDAKAKRGYFIGYGEETKGYRVWYPDTNQIMTVRDVVFSGRFDRTIARGVCEDDDAWLNEGSEQEDSNTIENKDEQEAEQREEADDTGQGAPEIEQVESHVEPEEVVEEMTFDDGGDNNQDKGYRLRDRGTLRPPERYRDLVDNLFFAENQEPLSYREATESKEATLWKKAMDEEFESLIQNNVWELVETVDNLRTIDCKWTFKRKRDANGNVQRHKARLVARGFRQREGIDYQETYSPVVRFDSIRTIIAIAASDRMKIKQFDVKTAFLYGDIEETIHMQQPEGYDDGTGRVCRLKRSLYGLKQSSRCWNQRFTELLKKFNLRATAADPCVFANQDNDEKLILAIYIDDGIIISQSQAMIDKLLDSLGTEFEITHDDANLFLGMQIERSPDGLIFLHQETYAKRILERFNMDEANPVTIPADLHQELSPLVRTKDKNDSTTAPYREAVGSLIYLSVATRPDITFAVHQASRYLENPTTMHWKAVKRIIKYLKGTIGYGLFFKCGKKKELLAYSEADYAGELERRSTTGFVLKFASGTISWNSQRQKSVALSTTDSEYMAACQTAKEIAWVKSLIKELLNLKDVPTTLHMDNQNAICLVKNPVYHKRVKHIDVRFHYVRERYAAKEFSLEYVASDEQQADILTKPLPRQQFQHNREELGIRGSGHQTEKGK